MTNRSSFTESMGNVDLVDRTDKILFEHSGLPATRRSFYSWGRLAST